MRILLLIFVVISFPFYSIAQQHHPELITDRPDHTESASIVPRRLLQIETGFVMENNFDEGTKFRSFAYNTTLLRYGLLDNLELRLGLDYLGEKTSILNTNTGNISGFGPIYTGFKVKVREEDGWKPETAFLGGLVFPFTAGKDFKPAYTAVTLRFAFAHTLSDRFSLGYNLGAEWDGFSARPGYYYSVVLGAGLTEKLGVFIENHGMFHEKSISEHMMDTGFTYLLLPNLQLDLSGGIGLNKHAVSNFIGAGLTWRIPG